MIVVKSVFNKDYYMPEMKSEIKAEWIKRIKENKIRDVTALDILITMYNEKTGNLDRMKLNNGFPSFVVRQWSGLPMDVAINLYNMTTVDKFMLVEIASYLERDVHL